MEYLAQSRTNQLIFFKKKVNNIGIFRPDFCYSPISAVGKLTKKGLKLDLSNFKNPSTMYCRSNQQTYMDCF